MNKTKTYEMYILNIKTEVFYSEEDNSFHLKNKLFDIKDTNLDNAIEFARETLVKIREDNIDEKEDISYSSLHIWECASDVQIFLDINDIKRLSAQREEYLNLLMEYESTNNTIFAESNEWPCSLILAKEKGNYSSLYKKIEECAQKIPQDYNFIFTILLEDEELESDVIKGIIKKIKRLYNGNIIICKR